MTTPVAEPVSPAAAIPDGSIVDAFSTHPPAHATWPRRIAIAIWGFGYVGAGRAFLSASLHRRSLLLGFFGAASFAAGIRIVLNAIPQNRRP